MLTFSLGCEKKNVDSSKSSLEDNKSASIAKIEKITPSTTTKEFVTTKQTLTQKETTTKKQNTATTANNYSDWIPYSTSDRKQLDYLISKGYVVYYGGQYLASPEYVAMASNTTVVYENDIGSGETSYRFALADN